MTLITKLIEFYYIASRIQAVRARKNSLWLQHRGGAKDTLGPSTYLDWTYAVNSDVRKIFEFEGLGIFQILISFNIEIIKYWNQVEEYLACSKKNVN